MTREKFVENLFWSHKKSAGDAPQRFLRFYLCTNLFVHLNKLQTMNSLPIVKFYEISAFAQF